MRLDVLSGLAKEEAKELNIEHNVIINKEKNSNNTAGKTTKQLKDEINQRKQALREVTRMQASNKIGFIKHVIFYSTILKAYIGIIV